MYNACNTQLLFDGTISANGDITLIKQSVKDPGNSLQLSPDEAINGIIINVITDTAANGFTGGGLASVRAWGSLDNINWVALGSAATAMATHTTTYEIRPNGTLPLYHKIKLVVASYDSGNYVCKIKIQRRN